MIYKFIILFIITVLSIFNLVKSEHALPLVDDGNLNAESVSVGVWGASHLPEETINKYSICPHNLLHFYQNSLRVVLSSNGSDLFLVSMKMT